MPEIVYGTADTTPEIEYGGDAGLVIRGVQWSAFATSDPDNERDRWTEVQINKLASGAFVVFGAGHTVVADEVTRHWVFYCPDAESLVRVLLRTGRGAKHLPQYAEDALTLAGTHDASVVRALASWNAASKWAR